MRRAIPLCEKIEETLGLTSSKNAKQEKGHEYTEHIYDIPEYGNSSQYGTLGYDNDTSEHIYEEIDELRDNKKEELSSNMSCSSSSVSSINSLGSSWNNDESKVLNLQSGDEKGSRTPESGYSSDDQQESKIVNHQPNREKPPIAPKPVNLQTRPSAKKMPENKISNSSFNKADFSFNSTATNIKKKIPMFENFNTPSSFNGRSESGNPSSKISLNSVKNKSNPSSQALRS